MSIENIKGDPISDEAKIEAKIKNIKDELAQKEPDVIPVGTAPTEGEGAQNPVKDEELFVWGKGQVENLKNDLNSLTQEQANLQRNKKIAELRTLISSYEEAIKAIERGEKYQVVLNKTNFDAKYDSVDKLHEQITQIESQLRELEQESLKNIVTENQNLEEPVVKANIESEIEPIKEDEVQSQVLEGTNEKPSFQEEVKKVIAEVEEAQKQLEQALAMQAETDKKRGIFSKLKKLFGVDTQKISEVERAQRVLDDARMRYEQILKSQEFI